MRLILSMTFVLTMAVPTAGTREAVGQMALVTQAPSVEVSCPHEIYVGPVHPPEGWESEGNMARQRFQMVVDQKQKKIVCWYGNLENPFQSFLISKKIPEGYECAIPFPKDYKAVCTRRVRKTSVRE